MARTIRITRRNSTFQVLDSLRTNRQKRHRTGTFLVEGVQPINFALRHRWEIAAFAYAAGAPRSSWASGVLESGAADRYELAPELLRELSGKQETSEILAVVRIPAGGLERIPVRPNLLVTLMDRPSNPGNLGTVIRSCDAFRADGVMVSGHSADIYDPAAVTASRGSLFAVPVVQVESPAGTGLWLDGVRQRLGDCQLVGADEGASLAASEHDFTRPTVLVLGNEAQGVSRAYRDRCDVLVRIPIAGSASSLNVAVAASILLYEADRQRRAAAGRTR